jgi:sterol desaturase/sphingolipid hydroxylase (fatty acid hydroxylase superfamily)
MFLVAGVISWGMLSGTVIADAVRHALTGILGQRTPSRLDPGVWHIVSTVVVFVAYDFAYWINHYASHRIGWLWEFHKVHHTAEVLTPLTNARVHPIDSVVFANFLAIFLGISNGTLAYCFGKLGTPLTVGGNNALVILYAFTFQHLQHSHIWIATTGRFGRIIFSPAHHQIHHSADRIHFDRNFGASLAVWDWMFGTLYTPSSQRERLTYGCASPGIDPHSATGSLLTPFVQAASRILQAVQKCALIPGFQTHPLE